MNEYKEYLKNADYLENNGLYDPSLEHDSCGVGFVTSAAGEKSHRIVEMGLTAVGCLTHRGAVDADQKTGDGSGIMIEIPKTLFADYIEEMGHKRPNEDSIAVGMFFMPRDDINTQDACRTLVESLFLEYNFKIYAWRDVPVDPTILGPKADSSRPQIEQLLISKPEVMSKEDFEIQLFIIQKILMRESQKRSLTDFYVCSLSSEKIIFKGLLNGNQLTKFYLDLNDKRMISTYCIFHQRYSTNTFPSWALAQPFRILAHNGEINTITGNRTWMSAREEELKCEKWGASQARIHPVIRQQMSDSASLDNAIEAVVRSGSKDILHTKAMFIPNAWSKSVGMSESLKSFYEYNNILMEPWDGPAAITFADGPWVGGALDRNGLRPARFSVSEDGLVVMGSETGLVPMDEDKIIKKGRLGPGETIAVNIQEEKVYYQEDINNFFEKKYNYTEWLKDNVTYFDQNIPQDIEKYGIHKGEQLQRRQILYGYSPYKLKVVIKPQAEKGAEAVGSMGDDTPLSILMLSRIGLYTYFRQRFAQVTNPPIDYIREKTVVSLNTRIVKRINLFDPSQKPENCIVFTTPYLTNKELEDLKQISKDVHKYKVLDATFPALHDDNASSEELEKSLQKVLDDALRAVNEDKHILILSDKNISKARAPIPMELAVSAVHNHLIRNKKRAASSIVVETGSAFEVHNVAVLMGYGACAVNSYLTWDSLYHMWEKGDFDVDGERLAFAKVCENYRQGMNNGLYKVMSKMGISVLSSYMGGQNFEAIGLSRSLISKYFPGTYSRISGIGIGGIEKNILRNHKAAFLEDLEIEQSARDKQPHRWSPKVVKLIRKAASTNDYSIFKEASQQVMSGESTTIRDMFDFVRGTPIPMNKVETINEIRRRFITPGMSHGALSTETHTDLAIAVNRVGSKSSSGEGGEDPKRYKADINGNNANSQIKQIASGRFGVTSYYLNSAKEIEIKIAQGAKPGEGGQLPGFKNVGEISINRMAPEGVTLISPPPHHDIYSIEDLAQLIYDLKQANADAQVTVKLVAEAGVGTIAAGVAKANADIILISGHSGGTGAAAISSIKYAGSPWELGLSEAHQVLVMNKLRDNVVLRTDGGLFTGRDVVMAACLGAEEYGIGTAALISLGCVMVRKCHLNTCPTGIATQDPKFRAKYKGKPEDVVNLFTMIAREVREILSELGYSSLDEIIGRTDLLRQITRYETDRLDSLDLNPILVRMPLQYSTEKPKNRYIRKDPMGKCLDDTIINDAQAVLQGHGSLSLSYEINNTDRTIGTKVSGLISRMYGGEGLTKGKLDINLEGTAGQSLGAWLVKGVQINLSGDANDYVGKGLCGGVITVKPHSRSQLVPSENVIIGNTCLYGSTSGELYCYGRAGERFGVRNSGATAVVEGAGDHFLEYMTAGKILSLGSVGNNMGSGMTGGIAYFYIDGWDLKLKMNSEYVKFADMTAEDYDTVKELLEKHLKYTSSDLADTILKDYAEKQQNLLKVVPN
ncbi:MAG: glutamate synthase large subunit [Spirochaetota bacterium]